MPPVTRAKPSRRSPTTPAARKPRAAASRRAHASPQLAFAMPTPPRRPKLARDGSRRGGARPGAGRKRQGERRLVPHVARPVHKGTQPLHVTLRVAADMPNLRQQRLFNAIVHAVRATNLSDCPTLDRGRLFRIVHFSVQSNHLHLVVEAADKRALRAGLTSLTTRLARALNTRLARRGRVWGDRYYARAMTVPLDVRNTLIYVLMNQAKHAQRQAGTPPHHVPDESPHVDARRSARRGIDWYSSARWFNGFAEHAHDEGRWLWASRTPPPVHAAQSWLLAAGWRRRHGLIDRANPFARPATTSTA